MLSFTEEEEEQVEFETVPLREPVSRRPLGCNPDADMTIKEAGAIWYSVWENVKNRLTTGEYIHGEPSSLHTLLCHSCRRTAPVLGRMGKRLGLLLLAVVLLLTAYQVTWGLGHDSVLTAYHTNAAYVSECEYALLREHWELCGWVVKDPERASYTRTERGYHYCLHNPQEQNTALSHHAVVHVQEPFEWKPLEWPPLAVEESPWHCPNVTQIRKRFRRIRVDRIDNPAPLVLDGLYAFCLQYLMETAENDPCVVEKVKEK